MKIKKKKKSVEALRVFEVKLQQELESIEGIFPRDLENSDIKNELIEIKKLEEKINKNYFKYESSKYVYNFRKLQIIKSFGESIFNGETNKEVD